MGDFQSIYAAKNQGDRDTSPSTLVSIIREKTNTQPDSVIHTFLPDGEHEGPTRTFAGLDRLARGLAAVLQERFTPGDRALLVFPPALEFIDAFFGCLYSGLVAVPAFPPNPSQREQTLTRLQALAFDSRASVILTTRPIVGLLQAAAANYPPLNQIQWIAIDEIPADAHSAWKEIAPQPDQHAYFQYTSGSTRTPHGVVLTHRNLVHNSTHINKFFELRPTDTNISWLPMYHNLGLIGAVLQPFFTGTRSYLMPPQIFLENPLLWLQAITRYRATVAGGPNFAYDLCVLRVPPEKRQGLDLSSWQLAFNGAEPILTETLRRFREAYAPHGFSASAFYPCYGLAEATLMVTGGTRQAGAKILRVDPAALEANQVRLSADGGQALVGSGRSFDDQELLIVDPDQKTRLPDGQVGEIWTRGPSVSPGYWNLPAETEETFHATLADGTGPYLRTGDLGFVLEQECFITGRLKELIIIRGRNLYPQDIEQTLFGCHPALVPNGGAAFSIQVDGEEKLAIVQEIDAQQAPDLLEVAAAMRRVITTAYQVQLYGVSLVPRGTIGRTISGKIQRRLTCKQYLEGTLNALYTSVARPETPAREQTTPGAQAQPGADNLLQAAILALGPEKSRDVLEAFLRARIGQIIGIPESAIERDQPLNVLGLDSVSTVELLIGIQSATGINIPLEAIAQGSSLADVVQQVSDYLAGKATQPTTEPPAPLETTPPPAEPSPAATMPVPGVQAADEYPLTYGQKALWFIQRLDPDDIAHNIVYAIKMHTAVEADALRRAMHKLTQRHGVLRTRFLEVDGQPVQRVEPDGEHFDFSVEDATGWSQEQLDARLNREVFTPFNLETGPLVRLRVLKAGPQESVIILGLHHIITDLWSMAMLAYETIELYASEVQQREPVLKAIRASYQDAVRAEVELLSGPEGEKHLAYWKERLAGESATALQLPGDVPRPAQLSGRAASLSLRLEPALVKALKALAAAHDTNLFTTLLTAFDVLAYRYTGQTDFVLATPKAMRNRHNATTAGYFINPVLLRATFAEDSTFAGLLDQTHRQVLADFAHDACPFPLLVEQVQPARSAGGNPLFQVFFSWQKTHRMIDSRMITALALNVSDGPFEASGIPVSTVALNARVTPTDLALLAAEGEDDLHLTVEYSTDLYTAATIERLLSHLNVLLDAAVQDPDQSIAHMPLLTEAERHQMAAWNTPLVSPAEDGAFMAVPAAILRQAALTPDSPAVEAGAVHLSYAQLAAHVRALADRLTALGAGPGKTVGLFAQRSPEAVAGLLAILQTGSAYLPLDPDYPQERLAYMLADSQAAILLTSADLLNQLPDSVAAVLCLEGELAPGAEGAGDGVGSIDQASTAYILYTSGSTGLPKGVMVSHRAIARHCQFMQAYYRLTPADRVLQFASLNFDASLEQIFTALMSSATLVLRENALWDPGEFSDRIAALGLSVVNVPPAYWEQWTAAESHNGAPGANPQLRLVIIGGDVMRPETLALWQQTALAKARLVNAYGPTEAVITATAYEVPPEPAIGGRVPVGHPLAGRTAYVLSSQLEPAPVGIPGELYLGGECLAQGYWQRPDQTAEKFVPDPFRLAGTAEPGGSGLYRTGDLARYRPDGSLEFLGRVDRQIKFLGIRIEPGEIEAALKQHPEIDDAAVVLSEAGSAPRLTACVRAHSTQLRPAQLTAFLAQRLPHSMIPTDFAILDELPLTPSGKLDRDALARAIAEGRASAPDGYVAPRSEIEAHLAGLWAQMLCVERVGVHDNFFALGGHSLLAAQVMSRVRSHYHVDIPLRDLFNDPTVENLAAAIVVALAEDEDEAGLDALISEIDDL